MAEENNKETTPKKKPIRKASTGAWWKSITPAKKKAEVEKRSSSQNTEAQQPQPEQEQKAPVLAIPETPPEPPSAPAQTESTPEQTPPLPEQEEKPELKSADTDSKVDEPEETPQAEQEAPASEQTPEQQPEQNQEPEQKTQPAKRNGSRKNKRPPKKKAEEKSQDEDSEEKTTASSSSEPQKNVQTKLLINAEEPEECRIALVEDGRLESFHVTTVSRERTKNNIYKGTIVSIEPNLQAAFVDMGTGRNGFLPFNEIHPEYYRQDISERNRQLISQHQWKKLKIEEVVKKGQEVLVQVVKEVTGNKGANITTYLSLPGRFLVLMPGSDSSGISRKITEEERRSDLRQMMASFNIPEGIGYIIRTASAEITKTAFHKDLRYLLRLWDEVKTKGQEMPAPALVYEEDNTVVRFLRDHYIPEISEILVDTSSSYEYVKDFIRLLPASQRKVKIKMHKGAKPIFNQFNIEEQIESIFKPQVSLPSGGSIVIDPTEALVAIDVNSGRTSKNADFEDTIFLANMEAARELARQLRLRDLGGLIVVDFIDMRNKKHIREVEREVRNSMKRDKAKVDTSRISRFGLMQISRQKMGAPIEKGSYRTCTHCQGRGVVRSVETMALYYLRRIQTGISKKKVGKVFCKLPLDVARYLLNNKRAELFDLEQKHNAVIEILPTAELKPGENHIEYGSVAQNGETAD